MTEIPPLDMLVEKYRNARLAKAALASEMEERMAPIADALEVLEEAIVHAMIQAGDLRSVKTAAGTATRKETKHYSLEDAGLFMPWIEETKNTHLLKRDMASTRVAEYVAANNGEVPPGVKVFTKFTLGVTAPTKKKVLSGVDTSEIDA